MKDRLLMKSQVMSVVDKHTDDYNRLDNDITCILKKSARHSDYKYPKE